ncbi:MAG: 3-hydroxyacyl-ACP dehydratase FabZ [Elusimicrobiaceae bacterium]|nr:3-hydroxyacyl-ACP dehydratase FabZ [Elusimicrobiaceae bacterium]
MSTKQSSLKSMLALPVLRVMDKQEIEHNIPHRDPFLLVDEVHIVEERKACIGIKKVTGKEYFFKGHFPQKPIMPGVLVLESIAQAFGAAAISFVSNGNQLPLFLGVEEAKFRGMVVPGDTLQMPVRILRLGKLSRIYAEAYVNDKLCTQAQLTFILGDNLHV